ncbi:MAG: glycine cleavage system aminomethyltransferase GcvT [Anaerolineales bacterium]|nr:glycine cleavage system aminomethyltransferase GcvT [Anaerolineales bacterium]
MSDYLFRGTLADLDPEIYELISIEAERQVRKLILIASESQAPLAIREALASAFQNVYAEGYPDEDTRWMTETDIFDYPARLVHYRRNSDPRYYKGVEYADTIEALARRRAAEAFAANGVTPDELYVNVQALSGAPANNAVYHLINQGDTVMGMNLLFGGHLSHGSKANRSGKWYNIVHYTIHPETQKLDYEQIREMALEHKPRLIISGFSSYPWMPDWQMFRRIADEVGAYLLSDISHVGGLVAAGVVPSPVGIADVVMSTTHKSLHGPRGAVLMTTNPEIARKIDRAVFPGEQGGPHVNVFGSLALAFKLAKTEQYRYLQQQTLDNAVAMVDQFKQRGLVIPFGGTDTHLINIDCGPIKNPEGVSLSGDQASRILDIVGVVVNRNTIPGDRSAAYPSGLRLGTPWITQRGFDERKSRQLADVIADVLLACVPYRIPSVRKRSASGAKLPFDLLNQAKICVRELALSAGRDFEPTGHGYPHFYYIDDKVDQEKTSLPYGLSGPRVRQFLETVSGADLSALGVGRSIPTCLHTPNETIECTLSCVSESEYNLSIPAGKAALAAAWLRDLSDSYILFDDDPQRRVPGPVVVEESQVGPVASAQGECCAKDKPYFIGMCDDAEGEALPEFKFEDDVGASHDSSLRTALYETHKEMGAKMVPFAGWEMPVWYSSVVEEHLATRQAAGLFDVSHMGVYEVRGADAASFLDSVCANDIGALKAGQSCYSHFLTPDAEVIDDTLIYRRTQDRFLVVVNASNDDKDRSWLEAVRDGKVRIDNARPWARTFGYTAEIANLRDPKAGQDMRVDIALQGPKSREILLAMGVDGETRKRIMKLERTELCDAVVGGFDLVVSRTGYTGEKMAFELFVHPDRVVELWISILKAGEPLGLKPVGLGARDSLRTEAGLPLYGHEMGMGSGAEGNKDLGVAEGGFGGYVKTFKPWFIGREAYIAREKERKGVVARFCFDEQRVRVAHNGDPVMNADGKQIGWVTSCAIDSERFLTGQAYVELAYTRLDTPLFIHQGGRVDRPASTAKVVSRFAKL